MDSIKRAASHMPRLDAVGGSAAGVYINNRVRVGSLYRGIPKDKFERIASMFFRIREELGVPMEVVNDGEVTALAGSMSLKDNRCWASRSDRAWPPVTPTTKATSPAG